MRRGVEKRVETEKDRQRRGKKRLARNAWRERGKEKRVRERRGRE